VRIRQAVSFSKPERWLLCLLVWFLL
jgi:hypothetical protein